MRLEKAGAGSGGQRKIFNSLFVINGNGEIVEARDKTQLVPFGEFFAIPTDIGKTWALPN